MIPHYDVDKLPHKQVTAVRVSISTHKKAEQLQKFLTLSSAKRAWGKDQKLIRCNLLLVPTSKNYTVLLAMGRGKGIDFNT